jgi:hypothetical protein
LCEVGFRDHELWVKEVPGLFASYESHMAVTAERYPYTKNMDDADYTHQLLASGEEMKEVLSSSVSVAWEPFGVLRASRRTRKWRSE